MAALLKAMQPLHPAWYSQAKQGGKHLYDVNNYQYTYHGATKNQTFYKCVLQKLLKLQSSG